MLNKSYSKLSPKLVASVLLPLTLDSKTWASVLRNLPCCQTLVYQNYDWILLLDVLHVVYPIFT